MNKYFLKTVVQVPKTSSSTFYVLIRVANVLLSLIPPNALRVSISTHEFWRSTSIQSMAPRHRYIPLLFFRSPGIKRRQPFLQPQCPVHHEVLVFLPPNTWLKSILSPKTNYCDGSSPVCLPCFFHHTIQSLHITGVLFLKHKSHHQTPWESSDDFLLPPEGRNLNSLCWFARPVKAGLPSSPLDLSSSTPLLS